MRNKLYIATSIIVLTSGIMLYYILWAPNQFDGERVITISKGESFSSVVNSLENAGAIRSRLTFEIAGRLLGLTTKMQIGRYRFKGGMSNSEILDDLHYGRSVELITVSIPEGLKATRQAKILQRDIGIDSSRFVQLVFDSNFTRSLNINSSSLEGYLMPNTYQFYWQPDEEFVIKRLVDEFWNVVNDTLLRRIEHVGMTLNEVLTLASIVEGETKVDSERAIIAGVYLNRLRKRIPLQADPTIQYILEDGPRRLKRSDLQRESPYNTYRHYGLPPGPINNPGRDAILAVLYPRAHRYYYFVATGQGGHTFSSTYSEHQRAARKYWKYLEKRSSRGEEK